ncbi:hypothetical protein, partial [Bacteroides salyersiae]|uniref:hypothetical protein n=1 Tax=Bacteroides salyersiae TaxID=291644 RepID=UPI001D071991
MNTKFIAANVIPFLVPTKHKEHYFKNYVYSICYFKIKPYLCTRNKKQALLAQLVEQLTLNQWVQG